MQLYAFLKLFGIYYEFFSVQFAAKLKIIFLSLKHLCTKNENIPIIKFNSFPIAYFM
jgi:hypothetical protein